MNIKKEQKKYKYKSFVIVLLFFSQQGCNKLLSDSKDIVRSFNINEIKNKTISNKSNHKLQIILFIAQNIS